MATVREYKRGNWVDMPTLTVGEARAVLDAVPESSLATPCKLNPGVSRAQAMTIFRRVLEGKADGEPLKSSVAKNFLREFGAKKAGG